MAGRPLQRLYRELRRRRVFRVAAAYAVVAYALVEAADLFFPALGLPGWAFTFVAVAAILGFPVALFIGWAFDITPEGVRRTAAVAEGDAGAEAAERASEAPGVRRIVAVGAITVAAVIGGAFLLFRGGAVSGGASGGELVAERIAVLPFENRTGDPGLDPVGRLAADWITQGVSRAGIGRVMPLSDLLRTFPPDERVPELSAAAAAEATGAGTVVVGSYYRVGGELQLQARVLDTRRDALIDAVNPVTADASDPRAGIERLRERVIGMLATVFDPREIFSGGTRELVGRPPTLEAYAAYADGIDRLLRRDWTGAIPLLRRATELDSSFHRSALMSLHAYGMLQRWEQADSLVSALEAVRSELGRPDRLLLESYRAHQEHDRDLAEDRYDQLAEMFPNSFHVYGAGWQGVAYNDPRRALRWLRTVDPTRGPLARWPAFWNVYAEAHHLLRDYRSELEVAGRALRSSSRPETHGWLELRPLAALGRFGDLRRVLERESPPDRGTAFWRVWLSRELEVHGHGDTAAVYLAEALRRYGALSPGEREAARNGIVGALYRAGRFDSARALHEAALAEAPEPVDGASRSELVRLRGRLGTIAARQGQVAEARRVEAWLASLDWPHMRGAPALWRSRIATALGEQDRAVALLRDGLRRADFGAWVHIDYDFIELRDHPGFRAAIRPAGGWEDP